MSPLRLPIPSHRRYRAIILYPMVKFKPELQKSAFLALHTLVEVLTKKRERRGHVLILYQNAVRHVQMLGREVPDRKDPVFNQQIAHSLRILSRDGDDADFDLAALADLSEPRELHDGLSALRRADERVVCVECSDDIEPVFGKAAVSEQRPSEFSGTNEHGVVAVAVAEEVFNVRNQMLAVVADFRAAAV